MLHNAVIASVLVYAIYSNDKLKKNTYTMISVEYYDAQTTLISITTGVYLWHLAQILTQHTDLAVFHFTVVVSQQSSTFEHLMKCTFKNKLEIASYKTNATFQLLIKILVVILL